MHKNSASEAAFFKGYGKKFDNLSSILEKAINLRKPVSCLCRGSINSGKDARCIR